MRKPSLAALGLFLAGCASAPRLSMSIRAYGDPDVDLKRYRSFDIVAGSDKEDPLLEKRLLGLVERKLLSRGFRRTAKDPDFLVALRFFSGPFERYVPPTTVMMPQLMPGGMTTTTGVVGGRPFQSVSISPGHWAHVPTPVGGGTATFHYRHLKLLFVDPERSTKDKPAFVWQGEAGSSGTSSDLLLVAPAMLDELIDEFPAGSKRPSERVRSLPDAPSWVDAPPEG